MGWEPAMILKPPEAGEDELGRLIEAHKAAYARWSDYHEFRQRLESESPRHPSLIEQVRRDEGDADVLEEAALIKLLEYPPATIEEARRKAVYLAKETRLREEITNDYAMAFLGSFLGDADV
jgi:hypothetical protein